MERNRVGAEQHTNSQIPKEGSRMTNLKFSRKRSVRALVLLMLGLALLYAGESIRATEGEHPNSETPGSDKVIIFSPIYFEDKLIQEEIEIVLKYTQDHNYKPVKYLDTTGIDDNPEKATAANFKSALLDRRGILFILSHGANKELVIEVTGSATKEECQKKVDDYVSKNVFAEGDLSCENYRSVGWSIAITGAAIEKYFKDSDTIVQVSACNSWSLRYNFKNARDFLGYEFYCNPSAGALDDSRLLWGRMHGVEGDGTQRPISTASKELPGGLRHQHRPNTFDTVLSPAVRKHSPEKDANLVAPSNVKGFVEFDTKMDTTIDPSTVISVEGCDAKIQDPKWSPPFKLEFTLQLNKEGEAWLTVRQSAARAERDFKNNLDGNTRWREGMDIKESQEGGKDHVGPNRDDFVWKIKCVEKKGTSFNFTVPVGTGGTCKAKTPALGSIQISEIWATVTNCKTGQPLPEGTSVTFTVNLKPGKEKPEHISDIESITVSAPGFKPKEIKGPFSAVKVSIPGLIPITIQVINLGTVCLEPQ
jgi:hypothetical protein